jgi:hypothetical protein
MNTKIEIKKSVMTLIRVMDFDPFDWEARISSSEKSSDSHLEEDMPQQNPYITSRSPFSNVIDDRDIETPPKPRNISRKISATALSDERDLMPCVNGKSCRDFPLGRCNLLHLPITETPCLYGPNCKSAGCKKIHPLKIFTECRRGEGCLNLGCCYLHSKDMCRFGERCINEVCKFIHPKDITK